MESNITKRTPLDEIELALGIAEARDRKLLSTMSSLEISIYLNKRYGILSSEEDIRLLYEPTIPEMEIDLRLQFESMGLYY